MHTNHRATGRKVLVCLEDTTRTQCVDIFVRVDGTFGFEAFRLDQDSGVGWCNMGQFSHHRFPTGQAALLEIRRLLPWVATEEKWRW